MKLLPFIPSPIYLYSLPATSFFHVNYDCIIFYMKTERLVFSKLSHLFFKSTYLSRPSYYSPIQILEPWKEDLNDYSYRNSRFDYNIFGDNREYWEPLIPFFKKIIYFKLITDIYKNDTNPFGW